MKTLLKYDFIYLKRTSKFIIFPAIAIFFAILSPVTAKYMNEILELFLGSEGVGFTFPDPTVLDSYSQYIGNLFEIFMIVTVFVGVSLFMREKNKGELPLLLSKPINRTNYLLSKFISFTIMVFITLLVSGAIFAYYTYYLFGTVDILITLNVTLLFMVYLMFVLSIALITAMFFDSYAGASVVTFVTFLALSLLGGFSYGLLDYLPGRITSRIAEVILGTSTNMVWYNIIVIVVISITLVFISIKRFNKYDI